MPHCTFHSLLPVPSIPEIECKSQDCANLINSEHIFCEECSRRKGLCEACGKPLWALLSKVDIERMVQHHIALIETEGRYAKPGGDLEAECNMRKMLVYEAGKKAIQRVTIF